MELAQDLLLHQRLLISSSTPAPSFNKLGEPSMTIKVLVFHTRSLSVVKERH